jgi:hypothetical protein
VTCSARGCLERDGRMRESAEDRVRVVKPISHSRWNVGFGEVGGGGTSNDFGLAAAYATARLLRLADGPDEVHRDQLARIEFKKQRCANARKHGKTPHARRALAFAGPHDLCGRPALARRATPKLGNFNCSADTNCVTLQGV